MAARIGLAFDGFVSTQEAIAMAQQAVAAGAQSLWMAEHLGYRSACGSCMAFAMAAPGPMLVPTAISPYLWHPMPVAMEMATLDELAPGRAAIALGVGNPLFLAESGKALEKPIPLMREYVEALRRLWTGEAVHMEGAHVRLAGARMAFTPRQKPPIYIAATGPDMLRLTGRIADGVVLSAALSLDSVRDSLAICAEAATRAGRDAAGFRRAGYLFCSVQESSRAAMDAVRPKLAFVMRNKFLAENVRRSGIPVDQEAVIAAVARRDLAAATALIPDEAVEAFAVAGTPAECSRRLQAYIEAGLEEPVISAIGGAAGLALILPMLREFAG
ncbi:LLM class flavin-dependent oxidoreductase [Siccirubricoccus phaeus]|uniref:LLM class flavin-dependent oxidoreductase n=1 Tax=Siccirubricoccus phaeus TaxID=2595053 RepID=UPI00165CD41E|nr:LLM class flavin-dependent oxidoreductase [Siccirubricoccus phaeus]